MSRLTWLRCDDRWRAGMYDIELAAPELWVCTRRSRTGHAEIVMTGGSLTALQERVSTLEFKRRSLRRSIAYFAAMALSILVMAIVLVLAHTLAPLVVIVCSGTSLISALKAIDCLIQRSWETVSFTYQ